MAAYEVKHTSSSKLRETLDFPVIDTDGHVIETVFVLPDFLKQVGGTSLVERYQKLMTEEDFKGFVFTNPVALQTRLNPDYFKGTCVESAVSEFLAEQAVVA